MPGDTCVGIANNKDITLTDFYEWNPAVGSNCQTLLAGYYVCVGTSGKQKSSSPGKRNADTLLKQVDYSSTTTVVVTSTKTVTAAPTPIQSGIFSGCTNYYQAKEGDTCITIVNDHFPDISVAQFESWNPAVGKNCDSLLAGYYYCIAV